MFDLIKTLFSFLSNVWSKSRENRLLLRVHQQHDQTTNCIYPSGGLTFILIDLVIMNVSPRKTVVVCKFDVQLLWNDPTFDWLPDPEERGQNFYPLHTNDPRGGMPSELVLNHRVYDQGTLTQQSPSMRGLLIGTGGASIPDDFAHLSWVTMPLSVIDQEGNHHTREVRLQVFRDGNEIPPIHLLVR